jgi:plastocyanin
MMRKFWRKIVNRLFLLCSLMLALTASATIHTVNLSGLTFSPANIVVQQGDTVRWVKTGGFHNVRESGGTPDTVFYSGAPTSAAFTYNKSFNAPLVGTYNYQCDVHFSLGMVGTVTVEAPPCDPADSLVAIRESDTSLRLYWRAPQAGSYSIYSTEDPALATTPPGAGWTLETIVNAALPGQTTTAVSALVEKRFFVVLHNCP